MRVAFIGLGTMGSPMVRNLLSAGFDLTVFNRTSSKSKELVQLGVTVAESPQMAARMVEVVCICVSDPDAVREVLLGEQGAFAGAKPGSLFINLGTVDPTTSRDLADACGIAGCGFVDAPVSGGVAGAIGGTLTIMVGASVEDFEAALPVLEAIGKNIVRVGVVGTGSAVKLINQLVVGANLAAVLEAFVLGELAGIEPNMLYDIVSQSTGSSKMLDRTYCGSLETRSFDARFSLSLLLKDVNLALDFANSLDASVLTGTAARQIFQEGARSGLGDCDMTAAILPLEQIHNLHPMEDTSDDQRSVD